VFLKLLKTIKNVFTSTSEVYCVIFFNFSTVVWVNVRVGEQYYTSFVKKKFSNGCKNEKNRLTFDKVIIDYALFCFYGLQCMRNI